MTSPLFDTAPGFDQPIAVLKHCHDKIRKQIATLRSLPAHLAAHGADLDAQQAATAVLRYFDKAAHLHHADEEQDLMPMLQATAVGDDAALLVALVPEILADHERMDRAWLGLQTQLQAIASGAAALLSDTDMTLFCDAYQAHMAKEESTLAPMAKRLFNPAQMQELGAAMQRRRGLEVAAAPAQPLPSKVEGATLPDLRREYSQMHLTENDVLADPIAQFGLWFEQALKAEVNDPNAMSVATVGADGKPTSRIVLIKQYDASGFTWYTNYDSEKGQQLQANPHAALLFFWSELERQVRIEGRVVKTSAAESDEYFHIRPLKSQLAAIASEQSAPIASRAALEANFAAVESSQGEHPERPQHWGGYRLIPEYIEFWQGRRSRFHDRIAFTLGADGQWTMQRLQP